MTAGRTIAPAPPGHHETAVPDRGDPVDALVAVRRFAAGMSHDFNNLLTPILGYAQLIDSEVPPGSPLARYAEEILKAGERASRLNRDLLTFSRRRRVNRNPLCLHQLARRLEPEWRLACPGHVRLELAADAPDSRVDGDAACIGEALGQLVRNAVEAMPAPGLLRVATRAGRADEPREHLVVEVSDQGEGIAPDEQDRVFEPFYSTRDDHSGLGLSLVHGVMASHEGSVALDSRPGHGTVARLYFPPAREPESPAPAPADRAATRPAFAGDEHVLLVDDDEGVRAVVAAFLRGMGHTVYEAPDGFAALELMDTHRERIDLVITDMVMPRMDGTRVAAHLRDIKPGVRFLYISGYVEECAHRPEIDFSANFLAKPFQRADLGRMVRYILDGD